MAGGSSDGDIAAVGADGDPEAARAALARQRRRSGPSQRGDADAEGTCWLCGEQGPCDKK